MYVCVEVCCVHICVCDDAHVYGDARVYGDAHVYGDDAHIYGGDAHVYGGDMSMCLKFNVDLFICKQYWQVHARTWYACRCVQVCLKFTVHILCATQ